MDDCYFIDPGCSLESAERTSTRVTRRANRKKRLTVLYIVEHPNQEGDTCIDWTSQNCWTNGWNCLWRGHSVYWNRPLIPPGVDCKSQCMDDVTHKWISQGWGTGTCGGCALEGSRDPTRVRPGGEAVHHPGSVGLTFGSEIGRGSQDLRHLAWTCPPPHATGSRMAAWYVGGGGGTARQERLPERREQGTRMEQMVERAHGRQRQ